MVNKFRFGLISQCGVLDISIPHKRKAYKDTRVLYTKIHLPTEILTRIRIMGPE